MKLYKESLFVIKWWFLLFKLSTAIRSKCGNEYCFVSSNPIAKMQTDAQNWCQSNQSKLIEVPDSSVQNAMTGFLNDFYSEIFNYNLFTNGKRFSHDWSRINGNRFDLTIRNRVDASYSYAYLIRYDSIALWAGRSDELKQGYICEGESTCSGNGYRLSPWCYRSHRVTEGVTWYESRNRCLANGGDLASFYSITADGGLNDINDPWLQEGTTYWIGIRQETWKWQSTNSEMVYSNWMHQHPVNYIADAFDCICIKPNNNWQWTECRCTDSYPFICISASSAIASTTTSSTTTTTTKTTTSALDTKATIIITKTSTTDDTSDEGQENIAPLYSTDTISWTPLVPAPNAGPDKSQSSQSGDSLDTRVAIGIGVGVGAGIILIAGIIIIVLVIFKKGCPKRKTEKNMTNQQTPLQPPDIIAHQTVEKDKIPDENPYVTVLRHSKNEKMDSIEKEKADAIQNIIYCELQFMTKTETSELHSNESINLVSEISGPTESLSHPPLVEENIEEPKETDCNDKLRDSVTKA